MIEVWPRHLQGSSLATCLTFCGNDARPTAAWLDAGEQLLNQLGQTPDVLTLHVGAATAHGSYRRTKKRALDLFNTMADSSGSMSLRLTSAHVLANEFFPSYVEFLAGRSASLQTAISVNVSQNLRLSPEDLGSQFDGNLLALTGTSYGWAFYIPEELGPESYLARVVAKAAGADFAPYQSYSDRMVRCRRNQQRGYSFRDGYMREVYEVNYLLDTHLAMPFRGRRLESYLRHAGCLEQSGVSDGVYSWKVPAQLLDDVRQDLESSGLILSSATEPLRVKQL